MTSAAVPGDESYPDEPPSDEGEGATGGTGLGDFRSQHADALVVTKQVVVPNRRGLHARAAAKFVTLAERFGASIDVIKDGQIVSARSIMGLMMLGAGKGSALELRAEGWDAREALEALTVLVEAGFNEQD